MIKYYNACFFLILGFSCLAKGIELGSSIKCEIIQSQFKIDMTTLENTLGKNMTMVKIQRCVYGDSNKGIKRYFALTAIVKTSRNNCLYGRVAIVRDKNMNVWKVDGVIQFPIYSRKINGHCPTYNAPIYISHENVDLAEGNEDFFISLMEFVDSLVTSELTIRKKLDEMGFINNFFCRTCSEFKKALINNAKNNQDNRLQIEFISKDSTSRVDDLIFSLGLKLNNKLWVLLLRYEGKKLFIEQISTVEI